MLGLNYATSHTHFMIPLNGEVALINLGNSVSHYGTSNRCAYARTDRYKAMAFTL